MRRWLQKLGFLAALALLAGAVPAAPETVVWKPITNGVLKVDERPAKIWEIYLTGKNKHLALVQLGARFLLLNTAEKEIFEIAPEGLERAGNELRWRVDLTAPAESPSSQNGQRKLLPSEDWTDKHAGRARIIRLRLSGEGRRLDVQLPATPDLRKFY